MSNVFPFIQLKKHDKAKNTSAKKYDFDDFSLCIQSGMVIIYFRFFCV